MTIYSLKKLSNKEAPGEKSKQNRQQKWIKRDMVGDGVRTGTRVALNVGRTGVGVERAGSEKRN